MRFSFLRFFFLFVFVLYPVYLFSESLNSVIRDTFLYNPLILSYQAQVARQDFKLSAGKAALLPELNFETSYKYVSEAPSMTQPAVGLIPAKTTYLGVNSNYDMGFNLSYLIFNGFAKEHAISLLELQKEMARQQLSKAQKETALSVIKTYKAIQQMMVQQKISTLRFERIDLQKKKAQLKIEQGQMLSVELLTLDLAKTKLQQESINIEASLDNLQETLTNLAGRAIQVDEPQLTKTFFEIPSLNMESLEEIRFIHDQQNLLMQNKAIILSKYSPTLGFNASFKYGKPGINPPQNEWMTYYLAALAVKWPLWDSRVAELEAQALDKELRSQAFLEDSVRKNLELTYRKAVRDYQTTLRQMDVLLQSITLSKERVRLFEQQNSQGVVSDIDYQIGQIDLKEAELTYLQAFLDLSVKMSDIYYFNSLPIQEWRIH